MEIFAFISNNEKLTSLEYLNVPTFVPGWDADNPFVEIFANGAHNVCKNLSINNSVAILVHDSWADRACSENKVNNDQVKMECLIKKLSAADHVYLIHHHNDGRTFVDKMKITKPGKCSCFEGMHEAIENPQTRAFRFAIDLLIANGEENVKDILAKLKKHVSADMFLEAGLNFLHTKNYGDAVKASTFFEEGKKLAEARGVDLNGLTADSDLITLRDTLLSPY